MKSRETKTAAMSNVGKNLPTEILLNIFQYIDDGATMLDSVSLVCRRWRKLAKAPLAWAGVCVKVEYVSGRCVDLLAPRILLRAPALRRVEFAANRPVTGEGSGPSVEEVMSRCRASIREIQLGNSWAMPGPARSMLLRLIERNCNSLRSFDGSVRGNPAQHQLMFDVIGQLENLEDLTLEAADHPQYSRQFRGAFPALRTLQYTVTNGKRAELVVHGWILQDLLNGASMTVRHLDMRICIDHPDVLEAIRKCTSLASLTLPSTAVSAVRGLTSLWSLKVLTRAQDELPDDAEMPACGSLPALRKLSVSVPITIQQDAFCGPMLQTLAQAAPNLRRLSVSTSVTMAASLEKDIEEALHNLHQLRAFDVSYGSFSFLPRLQALPALERLSMELRVPSRDFENCCSVVKELMERVHVSSGSVRVMPIPFKPQTFYGKKD